MSVVASNLIMGPGTLYTGLFGATEPTDVSVNTTPQASAWTDVGGTDGGVTVNIDQKFTELMVDQIVDSVGRKLTQREVSFDTNLAEPTLTNLQTAMNGGTVVTGAGFAALDPLNITSATQPPYIALIMDGFAPSATTAFRRRIIGRRCVNTSKLTSAYSKDKQTFIPVSFNAHYVSASIPIFHVVDQTS